MTAAVLDRSIARQPAGRAGGRRPRLQVLDQAAARRRSRHRHALLILFISVLVGFFAVAFVHATLVAGQQDLDAVRGRIAEARVHHAELARAVEEAAAPAAVVARATELGMVPAHDPVYLAAAAPVRDIEVPSAPAALIASEGPVSDRPATGEVAAAPDPSDQTSSPGSDRALRGSLGLTGGISAAVRLPALDQTGPSLAAPSGDTAGDSTGPEATASSVDETGTSGSQLSPAGASAAPTSDRAVAAASADSIPAVATTSARPASSELGSAQAATGVTSAVVAVAGSTPAESQPPVADQAGGPVSSLAGRQATSGTAGATASTSTSGLATAAAATGSG